MVFPVRIALTAHPRRRTELNVAFARMDGRPGWTFIALAIFVAGGRVPVRLALGAIRAHRIVLIVIAIAGKHSRLRRAFVAFPSAIAMLVRAKIALRAIRARRTVILSIAGADVGLRAASIAFPTAVAVFVAMRLVLRAMGARRIVLLLLLIIIIALPRAGGGHRSFVTSAARLTRFVGASLALRLIMAREIVVLVLARAPDGRQPFVALAPGILVRQ
jgi:hypothetical protein